MKKKLFLFSLMLSLCAFLSTVKAQPTYSSGISVSNGATEIATNIVYDGVQSLKITGNGAGNPNITITVDQITNWTNIVKVTYWVYSTGTWGGQYFANSDNPGWTTGTYPSLTANTWTQVTFDFSATPYASTAAWGQVGFQLWKTDEVLYLDEISFYDASDNLVYEIDASDVLQAPTSITVTPNPINAIAGKQQALSIAVDPADASKSVTYSSSNTAVAAVSSDGIVTTIGAGTATITATSAVDANISGSSTVNVVAANAANSLVYGNFENGLGNYDGVWNSWNNSTGSGPAPTATVVSNPQSSGNSSAKVLQVANCYQWGAVAFKAYNVDTINTIKFKAYSATEITDMTFELGINGGTTQKINTAVAPLAADTWTEFSFDVTCLELSEKQFYIKMGAASSQEDGGGTAYTFLIDSLIYIAGDGSSYIPVMSVEVSNAATMYVGETMDLTATVLPANATNKSITWSIVDPSADIADTAIIDAAAATLQAIGDGEVTIKGVTVDGGFISEKDITIYDLATGITVIGTGSATTITTDNGTLQMLATVAPATAKQAVTWSIDASDTELASISATGLLQAKKDGTVTVIATSADGTSTVGTADIVISNQVQLVTGVTITSASTITTDDGTLSLTATVTPDDATNKAVVWTIVSTDADTASISASTLTALNNGKVTIRATSDADDTIYDEMEITITNQFVALKEITIAGNDITSNAGTSQMSASYAPDNTDLSTVSIVWSLSNAADSAKATISSSGLLTAYANGNVTVVAKDANSSVQSTKVVAISEQVQVSEIAISGEGGATIITDNGGTLKLSAQVGPAEARIKDVVWSVSDDTKASVDQTGLVKAKADGEVYVIATAIDAGAYADSIKVTISGQVLVQSVDITVTSDTIKTRGAKLTLPIDVGPDNAADTTVTWSIISNDADTASIDAVTGEITPIRNGSIKVLAVANGNSTLKDSAIVVITNQVVVASSISLIGKDSVKTIDKNDGTLQMIATVNPDDADDDVIWGIRGDKFDIATIDEDGLVTAFRDGAVFVQVTSTLAPTVGASLEITITNQVVEPTELEIVSETGVDSILVNNGTLSLLAKTTPTDAVADVIWSIDASDADTASISDAGILTAIRNGKVTIKAVSTVADTVMDTFEVTIVNQVVEPTAISIVGTDSISTIDVDNGTLALLINTIPADADKSVTWSVAAIDADTANVNADGIVTALNNGIATIIAVSQVDSTVVDTFDVTITNQVEDIVSPDSIIVKAEGDVAEITANGGTLQLIAEVYPIGADSTVLWNMASDVDKIASITKEGLLKAQKNGVVVVTATSTIADTISGSIEISISGQVVLISSIEITAEGDATGIDVKAGTLQLSATVSPEDATETSVTWSSADDNIAIVSSEGLVTAVTDGSVIISAKSNDVSGVEGSITLAISNQTVGVSASESLMLYAYPNPVVSILFIENLNNVSKVELISTTGAVIDVTNEALQNKNIDVSALKNGAYVLRAFSDDAVYKTIFIKE